MARRRIAPELAEVARERRRNASAAVLVPLVERGGDWTVLLTQRARHAQDHAARSAFPGDHRTRRPGFRGGRPLREAHEEIGLSGASWSSRGTCRITGWARDSVTRWWAFVNPAFELKIAAAECTMPSKCRCASSSTAANHSPASFAWRTHGAGLRHPMARHHFWGRRRHVDDFRVCCRPGRRR